MYDHEPVVFAVTKFGADKLIVLLNKDSDTEQNSSIKALENAFEKIIDIDYVKVDQYDVVGIAKETVKAIDSLKDNDFVIANISGGRKTMALGLLYAAYARSKRVNKIVYCSEEKEVIYLPKLYFNLTLSQGKVLELISSKKYKTIADLALKIDISRGMLYRNMKELEDLGLIVDEDGLKLTDAGQISVL